MSNSKYTILENKTIKYALEKINSFQTGMPLILFVINSKAQVVASVTDGDIRRGLVNGVKLEDSILSVANKNYKYIKDLIDCKKINEYKELDLKIIPYVNNNFELIDFIDLTKLKALLPIDAVVMAGGKGLRLKPYTNDIPKPMLELAGKPIIAHNVDRLISYGVRNIYISVNHLKEQIIDYFKENYSNCNIKFIEENSPLGTIGSIGLVDEFKNNDILVMNADVLTNIDFYDFYSNYKNHNDNMSIATFNIRINIPYAVLDTTDKKINSLIEKPSYTYYSNAGIYLIQKEMLNYIPKNQKNE